VTYLNHETREINVKVAVVGCEPGGSHWLIDALCIHIVYRRAAARHEALRRTFLPAFLQGIVIRRMAAHPKQFGPDADRYLKQRTRWRWR